MIIGPSGETPLAGVRNTYPGATFDPDPVMVITGGFRSGRDL
jgi:hypothetical protein